MNINIGYLLNLLVLYLVFYKSIVASNSCPAGCSCMGFRLGCQNPTFPIYLPSGYIEQMDIRANISRIPTNAFVQPKETTLKHLYIYDSEISRIDSKAFNKLQVDHFYLDNLKLKNLSPRIFFNLTCTILTIGDSEIDVMPTSLFEGLTTKYLAIFSTKIVTLQTDVFKSASVSVRIRLANNKINTVQNNALRMTDSIDISGNHIKTFLSQDSVVLKDFRLNELQCSCGLVWMWEDDSPFKEFLKNNTCILTNETTTYLDKMDKSLLCKDVDITNISGIWEQPTTKSSPTTTATTFDSCPAGCYCSGRKLECQHPTFPIYLPSGHIEYMDIRGNISRIPTNAFVQPKESTLKYLRIYSSEVSRIDSKAFNKLQVDWFYLDNLKLKNLSPRIFFNLTCTGLHIEKAEIDAMPTSLFEGLTTKYLAILRNEIVTLQTDVFKSASVNVRIRLDNNKINTVQKNALRGNVSIDISRNEIKSFLFQDSVVLKDFRLNELQCSCGLVWMLENDSPFKEFLKNNTCILTNGTTTYLDNMNKFTLCEDVYITLFNNLQ